MQKIILLFLSLLYITFINAQQRWKINNSNGISWQVEKDEVHYDHIEMAGKRMAVVLRYGVNKEGGFELNKSMIWPMLRTIPNNTHGSLMRRLDWNPLDAVTINGRSLKEQVKTITLNGTLEVISEIPLVKKSSLSLKRTYLPSTDLPSLIEIYEFTNTGDTEVNLEIPAIHTVLPTNPKKGIEGSYVISLATQKAEPTTLLPSQSYIFTASVSAYKPMEKEDGIDANKELSERKVFVNEWMNNLVLETPDPILDKMFAFSKIRACESVYETKGGPMHGPGGESYYAAIWANDQAEYINPYFPFIGYQYGNASAFNSFEHFARYMNDEWKPIPSSIVAEGDSYWNGAGDRGDAAMIAYGAARYALANGNKEEAEKLWPLIEWCLEFSRRKMNESGVIASDTDELEGRFPAGKANLCTSSLYYDALLSAAYLAEDLKKGSTIAKTYRKQASQLEKNIDSYFAATVEGFDTYAYYKGNDILRAWICIPLTVGIDKRAEGTIDALFSPRLWTDNGLLTQAGSQTFWDRSTLYALRGAFMAGEVEKAMKFMKHYSTTRLLGNHVPYAIEAWPEGGQRHLSAESALYGRIITEGIFGIRPTGLHSFSMVPRLPQEWNEMSLRKIKAFGTDFDVEVKRVKDQTLRIIVKKTGKNVLDKTVKSGTMLDCKL
ncbi:hypothetical protein [Bacteroides sp. GM023]|uniref:hypothetical protein n=1 Tax=Bacteroides sp. GM023 TaxID=2723058 RepID=UPI00168BCB0D|nr:hypothetical protein [Bacteroides sp. GM023]MBD3588515.1 hypothetical protein [Bacteroides sp. GM023]